MTIMWCMVLEIWGATDIIFCHFELFFAFYLPNNPENQISLKMNKTLGNIILHMCIINENHDVWFLRYGARQNFFSFWITFCPFAPLTTQKMKILKQWKNCNEISSCLHMCIINDTHMMYGSSDMKCNRQKFLWFCAIF